MITFNLLSGEAYERFYALKKVAAARPTIRPKTRHSALLMLQVVADYIFIITGALFITLRFFKFFFFWSFLSSNPAIHYQAGGQIACYVYCRSAHIKDPVYADNQRYTWGIRKAEFIKLRPNIYNVTAFSYLYFDAASSTPDLIELHADSNPLFSESQASPLASFISFSFV